MAAFKLKLGDVPLELTSKRLIVRGFRRGMPHLTVFFEPQPEGERLAGLWTPHISRGGRAPDFLARLAPEAVSRVLGLYGRDLSQRWLAASEPIDLQELTRDGWLIYRPNEAWCGRCIRTHFQRPDGVYRITERSVRNFANDVAEDMRNNWIPPTDLPAEPRHARLHVAVRAAGNEDEIECAYVSVRPSPEDGLGHWQRTPFDWLRENQIQLLSKHAGPALLEALNRIASALHLRAVRIDEEFP